MNTKLIAVMLLAVALTGCVFQPVHIEVYNAVELKDSNVVLDASRNAG